MARRRFGRRRVKGVTSTRLLDLCLRDLSTARLLTLEAILGAQAPSRRSVRLTY